MQSKLGGEGMNGKRKNSLKKILTVSLSILLICNSILSVRAVEGVTELQEDWQQVMGNIKNSKTAVPTGVEGEYQIELKFAGEAKLLPTDIVLIADKSASMRNDLEALKTAMNQFVDGILGPTSVVPDTRISLVQFSGLDRPGSDYLWGSEADATLLSDFTNDADVLKQNITGIQVEGSTNAEAGWLLARRQMEKANPKSSKYVVFFTDGLPNRTVDGKDNDKNRATQKAIEAYQQLINDIPGVGIYSVGMIKNVDWSDKEAARNLLSQTQNKGKYFIEDNKTDLSAVYREIAENIKYDRSLANDAVLTDEVTEQFEIISDSSEVLIPGADGSLTPISVTPNIVGNTISWNLGNVGVEGRIVRFKIRLKDQYYGIGDDLIPTNKEATLDYTNPDTAAHETVIFQKPSVTVPYKTGSITISKTVEVVPGITNPENDNFNILLSGENQIGNYSINLQAGETKVLNFKLKHADANVSEGTIGSTEFLNIGVYDIREILPMNYELKEVYVNGVLVTDYKFTLDNTQKNIQIQIVNQYVNDKYFYDKDEEVNILDL